MHHSKDSSAMKAVAGVDDIEKNGHASSDDHHVLDPPQLNVGGHGGTQRRLKDYQVTMIGFCSGIGTGLFIGTGSAYATAGPAGLLLAYIVVGAVLWAVMQSIAELATLVNTLSRWSHKRVGRLWFCCILSVPGHADKSIDSHCRLVSSLGNPLH